MEKIIIKKLVLFLMAYFVWWLLGRLLAFGLALAGSEGMGPESISDKLGGFLITLPVLLHGYIMKFLGNNSISYLTGLLLPLFILFPTSLLIEKVEGKFKIKIVRRLFIYAVIAVIVQYDLFWILAVIIFEGSWRLGAKLSHWILNKLSLRNSVFQPRSISDSLASNQIETKQSLLKSKNGILIMVGFLFTLVAFILMMFYSFNLQKGLEQGIPGLNPPGAKRWLEGYSDFEDFKEKILYKEEKPFYLVAKNEFVPLAWIPPGVNSFLSGLYVHLDEKALKDAETTIDESEVVIAHGYFKDPYIDTPVSPLSSKTTKERYKILYVDDMKKIEFYQLNCPEKINPEEKFQVKLWLRNPFNESLTINVLWDQSSGLESLNSGVKKAVNLSPDQESELVFDYKAKKNQWGDQPIYYDLFGKNESGVVYLPRTTCNVRLFREPELLVELESGKSTDDYIIETTKLVKFRIENVGDFEIKNINLKIRPDEGLFTEPASWYVEKLSGGEQRIFSFNLINSSKTVDDFSFTVNIDVTSTSPPEDDWKAFVFYIKPKP